MQPRSGRDRAYAYLRDQVLSSPAATGTFLNEQQLATQIGVSRTPVREALLTLQAEGLVEMVPKRGVFVPAMSGRQIAELMDLRGALERHAASTCLRTDAAPVTEMRSTVADQHDLCGCDDDGSAQRFIDLDTRFHQILVDAAGSTLLSRTYAGLRARQLRIGMTALLHGHERRRDVCAEHLGIVDALADGDEHLAHRAIDEHLKITLQILLQA
ncbi:GntR family transcriptional regulator [Mycolicibacterium sp. 018/SC-01/001]|uniref:GntR family transcriptional regulator n=1 Tax=Mycolicibacterium sp. 018/SC-01/001 TaxID=2592069 RepID=UPI00117F9089|nr:GntR family transcriptional regulator [Mycolicibacterium sp. 018/SC-01/001]TRW77550.1 GntR family transcriptional regulator [Mycolicibacterium sp. 018/SC-01/001]